MCKDKIESLTLGNKKSERERLKMMSAKELSWQKFEMNGEKSIWTTIRNDLLVHVVIQSFEIKFLALLINVDIQMNNKI